MDRNINWYLDLAFNFIALIECSEAIADNQIAATPGDAHARRLVLTVLLLMRQVGSRNVTNGTKQSLYFPFVHRLFSKLNQKKA